MRMMRKMPEKTVSTYLNFTLAFALFFIILSEGEDAFGFMLEFDLATWVLITLAGLFSIMIQVVKFLAFRYEEVSKLQKLAFLPNVWQFAIDFFVLNLAFTPM